MSCVRQDSSRSRDDRGHGASDHWPGQPARRHGCYHSDTRLPKEVAAGLNRLTGRPRWPRVRQPAGLDARSTRHPSRNPGDHELVLPGTRARDAFRLWGQ